MLRKQNQIVFCFLDIGNMLRCYKGAKKKKTKDNWPQPGIEPGTSCNLVEPKAGIIPLDH